MAPSLSPTSSKFSRVAVEDSILGFRTSATFLASLGDNLRLNSTSPFPSPNVVPQAAPKLTEIPPLLPPTAIGGLSLSLPAAPSHKSSLSDGKCGVYGDTSYPNSRRGSTAKSSSRCETETNPLIDHQPLHNVRLDTQPSTKAAALVVLGDTVRFQSLTALKSLFTHPLNLACFALLLFLVERLIRNTAYIDHRETSPPVPVLGAFQLWLAILTTWSSLFVMVAITAFIALRIPYRDFADEIDATWLGQDELIVATSSQGQEDSREDILGVLVMSYRVREVPGFSKSRRRRVGRAFLRGWAVARRHQHHGVGEALLREAVRVVSARGGDGAWFVDDHAHSASILPHFYNGVFEKRDRAARRKLEALWEAQRASPRRRG